MILRGFFYEIYDLGLGVFVLGWGFVNYIMRIYNVFIV